MQQIIKKHQPLIGISVIVFAIVFMLGCNSGTQKTDPPPTEITPTTTVDTTKATSVDSLPPVDHSASSRPEGIKTVPTAP